MNLERPRNSTASVSSSNTLRPRTRRRTSEAGEEESSSQLSGFNPLGSAASLSRNLSPIQSACSPKASRTASPINSFRQPAAGTLHGGVSSFWENSWSSLASFTSSLIRNEASRGSSPARRKGGFLEDRTRDVSALPDSWGPAGKGDKQLGVGTEEERRSKMQVQRRRMLLQANGYVNPDTYGQVKRRDSDESFNVTECLDQGLENEALVYIHQVVTDDTVVGIAIKYGCDLNVFRKANRLWPNDTIQSRKTVLLPLEACSVKGRKLSEPDSLLPTQHSNQLASHLPLTGEKQVAWSDSLDTLNKPTSVSSIQTSPSTSANISNFDETHWKHDSWVTIDNFVETVEIARVSRRALGYFPRTRRKSVTSDLETPAESLDLPQQSYQVSPSPSRIAKSRSPSGSFFVSQLQGPGGVGTMGKNVHSPGPAQDSLNKLFAAHLPGLAPPHSTNSLSAPITYSSGSDNIGGAVEGWMRKLAVKAASTLQGSMPTGNSSVDDMIELREDAFEAGEAKEVKRRNEQG